MTTYDLMTNTPGTIWMNSEVVSDLASSCSWFCIRICTHGIACNDNDEHKSIDIHAAFMQHSLVYSSRLLYIPQLYGINRQNGSGQMILSEISDNHDCLLRVSGVISMIREAC